MTTFWDNFHVGKIRDQNQTQETFISQQEFQFLEQFWNTVFPTANLHWFLMCFFSILCWFFKARPLRNTAWAHEFRRSAFSKKIRKIFEKSSQNPSQIEPKSSLFRSKIKKNRFKTALRTQMRPKTRKSGPRSAQEANMSPTWPHPPLKPDLAGERKAHQWQTIDKHVNSSAFTSFPKPSPT